MGNEIKAGVVVVTRFCKHDSSAFSEYINYIDRDEAARNEMLSEYNLYNDYMDDPEKTTGLFTKNNINLNMKEKQDLKNIFVDAQANRSLMWQTVISFDNRWLEEHGLYDSKNKIVDERKLKEIATGAVNKMLKNEGLENAVWSAAIHYNTDNLHIHIATVEPNPMREMKEYQVYTERLINGKTEKVPLRNANGELVKTKEYIGRFKGRSIELCKKHMVDEILGQREQNIDINKFIREQVVRQKKEHVLSKDADLKDKFLDIYKCLPRTGNRGLWNYNNNAMNKIRPMLDSLSDEYINKYHAEEYKTFLDTLTKQSEDYKTAYGKNSSRDFKEGKIKELHERLGNQILKEMKEYDIRTGGAEYNPDDVVHIMEEFFDKAQEIDNQRREENELDFEVDLDELKMADYIMDWTKEFKEARTFLYGEEKKIEEGLSIMAREAEKGNVLAVYELGSIHKYGIGVDIDFEKADYYFSKTLDMFKHLHWKATYKPFESLHESGSEEKKNYSKSYLAYRIGKQYYYGLGTEQSYEQAFEYLKESALEGNIFAAYTVGNMYYNGEYVEKDKRTAIEYYKQASLAEKLESIPSDDESAKKKVRGNAYADFKLGMIYESQNDMEKSQKYYSVAYNDFYAKENADPDDNLEYKLGMMNLKGLGVEVDPEEAEKYLSMSANNGNVNAQYQYAKILMERGEVKDIKRALRMLKRAADKNSVPAQYALGKFYATDEKLRDDAKAIQYLTLASEKNPYAKYQLGKVYENQDSPFHNMDRAMEIFTSAADDGISFVQYKVGKIYLDKESGYYDMEKAVHYLTLAAEDGSGAANYKLGKLYEDKESGYYDIEKAIHCLTLAVEDGCEPANYRLGKIYGDKDGGHYDAKRAVECFTEIADKGNEFAQYKLGKLYIDQESEVYNPLKAVDYFKMASDQGNEFASVELGFIYLKGADAAGLPSNQAQARFYFDKAAQSGNELGKKMVGRIDNPYISRNPRKRMYTPVQVKNRGAYEIERALKSLERAFESTLEKEHIIRMHEQLLEQERREKERDEKEPNRSDAEY